MNLHLESALDQASADLRRADIAHRFHGTDDSAEVLACARALFNAATERLQRAERLARQLEGAAASLGMPFPVRWDDEEPAPERCAYPSLPDWALTSGSPCLYTAERNDGEARDRYEEGRPLDHG